MYKEQAKILIVDDDPDVLLTAEIVLKQKFSYVKTATHPDQINSFLEQEIFDIVLLDMNYAPGDNSGKDGLRWIQKINSKYPQTKIIVITAYSDVDIAVEAMKLGAADFVTKPWEYAKIQTTVFNVFKLCQTQQELHFLKTKEKSLRNSLGSDQKLLLGNSAQMQEVFKTIAKVAKTNANVLILGENGTGKGMVANSIHAESNRSKEIFMPVDLGSLSENLFESELFGHKKGAFTDAKDDRIGRFEAANGGTVFLDEIGNLSASMQAKLLTVIQEEKITRVGENKARPFDARIISATNRPISELIEKEEFREDLYYRINTIEITLPSLRERTGDIQVLAEHFLEKFCKKYQKPLLHISSSLVKKLEAYRWPGNIRELEHAIERAVILAENNQLSSDDFLLKTSSNPQVHSQSTNLEDLEKTTIQSVIEKYKGNMSKVAKELGIGRTTLYRKLEKYGI